MIDGIRLSTYLDETGLSADQFWLLYRIMLQEPLMADMLVNVHGIEKQHAIKKFSLESKIYQETHRYFNGQNTDYVGMCQHLEEKGFLEIWAPLVTDSIKLKDLKVTDKFKKNFFSSDLDTMIEEVIKLYPKELIVTNDSGTRHYKTINMGKEALKDKYNALILKGGDKQRHYRFLSITETFIEDSGSRYALYGIDKYLTLYDSIALEIEARNEEDSHERYESL